MTTTTPTNHTLWVCIDCYSLEANGEGPDGALSKVPDNGYLTMGLTYSNHECGDSEDAILEAYDAGECFCEEQHFSWSQCEGCGSTLGGSRHALTWWAPVR